MSDRVWILRVRKLFGDNRGVAVFVGEECATKQLAGRLVLRQDEVEDLARLLTESAPGRPPSPRPAVRVRIEYVEEEA